MIVVTNYFVAILCCVLAMICWGSWQNTRNLANKKWRFELYYWDFVAGILLSSLVAALTIGSLGSEGRTFANDVAQAEWLYIGSAALGGAIWNLGTLLLVAAISIAGMSVAFPVGGGIGWLLGIAVNYNPDEVKSSPMLFGGMAAIIIAILLSMRAYQKLASGQKKTTAKGFLLALSAGLLIAFFYKFVAFSLAANEVTASGIILEAGRISPYTAVFSFSIGFFVSTFIFNPIMMRNPVEGKPLSIGDYLKGGRRDHFWGMIGGAIWCIGNIVSFMAASSASPAISYGLSNAAPVVAAFWGIFVWKEFKDAPTGTPRLLSLMFLFYIIGLTMITIANI